MLGCLLDVVLFSLFIGVGVVQSSKLVKIGLYMVQDLLLYLFLCYEDCIYFYLIVELFFGVYVIVEGEVFNSNIIFGGWWMMICQISDGIGIFIMCFFNFNVVMKNSFVIGCWVLVYGEVKCGKYGVEMIYLEYCVQGDMSILELQEMLILVYLIIEGIKQVILCKFIDQVFEFLEICVISEFLLLELVQGMMSLLEVLCMLYCLFFFL